MAAISRRSIDILIRGIHLSSRYDKLHEIEHMKHVVESMDLAVICHIESVWCDSKACALYLVTLKSGTITDRAPYDAIPKKIANAFSSAGGHNGVHIITGNKTFDFDPSWPDEDI